MIAQCQSCGQPVSTLAAICPFCGTPISTRKTRAPMAMAHVAMLAIGGLLVLAMIVVIFA